MCESHPSSSFFFLEKKELFRLVAFPFFLFIENSFHVISQLGVWRLWWFNYPGPLLEVELESACLSGLGCGLCIALIRPNHCAASVAQWLEHLSSKQCVVRRVRIPPELLFFLVNPRCACAQRGL